MLSNFFMAIFCIFLNFLGLPPNFLLLPYLCDFWLILQIAKERLLRKMSPRVRRALEIEIKLLHVGCFAIFFLATY